MRKFPFFIVLALFALYSTGCGYTTGSNLPSHLRTVYVENFRNKIDYTTETGRNIYFPLLEVKARDAVINRYQFDGNLKITKEENADLILKGVLKQYDRSALRFTDNDDVEEYRVYVVVDLEMWDMTTGGLYWEEKGFTGEATYFAEGPLVTTEESAVDEAIVDLARRIVERTIEFW